MLDVLRRLITATLVFVLASAGPASAQTDAPPILRCRGSLQFGDALGRAAIVYVDIERGQVTTPACRKYPDLDRYCTGILLDIAPHSFQFGGAVSPENTRFWADLYRVSTILPPTAAGPATEAMRVLFLGRCEPIIPRRSIRLK